jgi:hypothetical protein
MGDLALVAGAYLGEVIRSNTADRACWSWVNYDDYIQAHPEFRKQRPREFGFLAFLDSATNTTYPLAHMEALLHKAPLPSAHAFAKQLVGGGAGVTGAGGATAASADSSSSRGASAAGSSGAAAQAAAPRASAPANGAAAEDATMKLALLSVREALAKWRRVATPTDVTQLRAAAPSWIPGHPLQENVAQQALLLKSGEVVWGALIQANNALFRKGPDDHPGAVLFSNDPYFDGRPQELYAIANKLLSFKGTQAPESLRPISDWLTDEKKAAFNLPVPSELTPRPAFATGILFFRKHLPQQLVGGAWMPLIVHSETRAIMVVPRQFWVREISATWQAR